MPDAEQRALALYELIRATSDDRPTHGFDSVSGLLRVINAWKDQNEALKELHHATGDVHLAFLAHTCAWLREEYRVQNYESTYAPGRRADFSEGRSDASTLPSDRTNHQ